jgi:hypothetical protein
MAGHCVDEFNPTSAHRKSEGTLIPEPQVLQDFWRYGFTRIARAAENHKVTIVQSQYTRYLESLLAAAFLRRSIAVDYGIADGADALNRDTHFIASDQRPNASRRAGQYQITREQGHYL